MRNRTKPIDEFELLSRVEVSPMGSLYVALDGRNAQKPVLLWVFDRPGMVASTTLATLTSPGESPVPSPCLGEFVRCGLHRGTGFAAYERLAGPTLSEIMQRSTELEAKMPADLALMVTSGIAAALETTNDGMSDVAIPHGCLSPYFVLLMDDGPTCLFGFEIAQALIDWDRTHELRTPLSRYIAPEIRQGASPDASGDVYSLGSMLFELLTGRPLPLDSAEQQATIENELDGRGLTADVAKLIKHSLTDQVERWPDASIWKRRARKIMRDRDYQPSSETQESFLRTLFDDQPMAAANAIGAAAPATPNAPAKVEQPTVEPPAVLQSAVAEPVSVQEEVAEPASRQFDEESTQPVVLAPEPDRGDDQDAPITGPEAAMPRSIAEPREAVETSKGLVGNGTGPIFVAREPELGDTPPPPIDRRTRRGQRSRRAYLSLAAGLLGATTLTYLLISPASDEPSGAAAAPIDSGLQARAEGQAVPAFAKREPQRVWDSRESASDLGTDIETSAERPRQIPQPAERFAAAEPTAQPTPSSASGFTASSETRQAASGSTEQRAESASEPRQGATSEQAKIVTPRDDTRAASGAVAATRVGEPVPAPAAPDLVPQDLVPQDTVPQDTVAQGTGAPDPAAAQPAAPGPVAADPVAAGPIAGRDKLAATAVISEEASATSSPLAELPGATPPPAMHPANPVETEAAAAVALAVPGEALVEPLLLEIDPPRYPLKARRLGLQGTVLVSAYVTQQGEVEDVKLVEGLGGKTGIDAAALEAVRSARFQAGSQNGVTTAMWHTVAVSFRLDD